MTLARAEVGKSISIAAANRLYVSSVRTVLPEPAGNQNKIMEKLPR